MWWGLLAAASLAVVSVVGILKLDRNTPPTQIAKNEREASKSAPATRPADKTSAPSPAPPEPARATTTKVPKPLTDSKTADKKALANEAEKPRKDAERIVEKDAKATAAGKAVEMATEVRKQQDEHKPEILAQREERPIAPAVAVPPPPAPAPQQSNASSASNGGPLPTPQQQNAMGNAREPSFRAAPQQPAAQDQLKMEVLPLSARQLYFAGGSSPQPDALSSTLEASKEQTASRDRASAKRKAASPPPGGAAGGLVAPKSASAQGRTTAAAPPAAKPGFAMRYQLLRKAGMTFAPVPPGTRFRIGEEVVVVIEKNSGGVALINRVAEDGSTTPVAMSIQTNEQARSVPLTVTGPIELVLILSRSNTPRGISAQQGAQQTEIADGRVYVAEPSASADQSLLARISIRVE